MTQKLAIDANEQMSFGGVGVGSHFFDPMFGAHVVGEEMKDGYLDICGDVFVVEELDGGT